MEESVRLRLILAGIKEIEDHGVKDFSLRRAALAAQVSCAAPYRHFKDKSEYIAEIVGYIASRWLLLVKEIEGAYGDDPSRLIKEMSIAYIRFWVANPNFRSVLMLSGTEKGSCHTELEAMDIPLLTAIENYQKAIGRQDLTEVKRCTALSFVYGAVLLHGLGSLPSDYLALLKQKLDDEFPETVK